MTSDKIIAEIEEIERENYNLNIQNKEIKDNYSINLERERWMEDLRKGMVRDWGNLICWIELN